jgi:hypothetical protein
VEPALGRSSCRWEIADDLVRPADADGDDATITFATWVIVYKTQTDGRRCAQGYLNFMRPRADPGPDRWLRTASRRAAGEGDASST